MTIKELAYSTQQHLQASTGVFFKRAHIYELLAASFGFNSYAALVSGAVFTEQSFGIRRASTNGLLIQNRCVEIGYKPEVANAVSVALPAYLTECAIGVIRIADLVVHLRVESGRQDDYPDDDDENRDDWDDSLDDPWANSDVLVSPILLDGLGGAASKGNALAHYALAFIRAPDEDAVSSEYWYTQAREGRVLSGVEKEWADAHATHLAAAEKYEHHLREAARLGNQQALLDLAEQFDDPAFFEQSHDTRGVDPSAVAEIAERMGRMEDVKHWLTVAAEAGDTEAMRQLIEEYDQGDLQRCWTWVYFAELLGTDLTRDEYYAIHEDGSLYDDDVGGPLYADGRDGVKLDPISPDQASTARNTARALFEQTQQTR